ncbi:hypothetical protein T06_5029 [Trichinella sp. T6]|nr:hypothetical protein T06_5029 [Trichinella sp. T6]
MWKAHSVQLREEQRTLQTFLSVLCQQALCTDYAEDCGKGVTIDTPQFEHYIWPQRTTARCAKETSELNPVLSCEFKQ